MNAMKTIAMAACGLVFAFGAKAGGFTVTGSTQTNGRLSSLTLAFPAAAKASSVWIASGPKDEGSVLGNWQTLSFGADIAAGDTSCTVPVNLKGGETAVRLIMLEDTDEYVELESVSSGGSAYVTTGFMPGGNTYIRCDFKWDALGGSALFGARVGAGSSSFCMLELSGSGWRYDYANEIKNSQLLPVLGRRYLAEMDYKSLRVNGDPVQNCSRTTGAVNFSAGKYLMLFAMNNGGEMSSPAQATIYSFKAWSDLNNLSGTLVSDLVPCKKKDGTVGFINRKTGGFQTNSGTLTAGPVAAHSTLGTLATSTLIDACGLKRTMSVAKLYRKSKKAWADLTFSAALADSLVVAAYGAEDAGETLADWPHTEMLGVVAANETSKTVTLSATLDDSIKAIRYFLLPRCASAAYDRQFDGIHATGTQYVLTDFTPTWTANVIADFTFDTVKETQVPFSARTASGSNAYAVLHTSDWGFRLDYQSYIGNSGQKATADKRYRLDVATYLNFTNVTDGGALTRAATVPDGNKKTFTAGAPLTLFALNSSGAVNTFSKAVCHRFYVWKSVGGERVLDLVPCEKNGEVGFYNKVDGKFYGNSGTGAFEAVGPETVNTNAQVVAVTDALMPPVSGLVIIVR